MSHDPFEARDGTCVNPSAEPAIASDHRRATVAPHPAEGHGRRRRIRAFRLRDDRLAFGDRADGSAPLTSPRSDAPLTTSITSRPDTTRRC